MAGLLLDVHRRHARGDEEGTERMPEAVRAVVRGEAREPEDPAHRAAHALCGLLRLRDVGLLAQPREDHVGAQGLALAEALFAPAGEQATQHAYHAARKIHAAAGAVSWSRGARSCAFGQIAANDVSDFKGRQREYLSRAARLTPSGTVWSRFTSGVRPWIMRSAIAQSLFRAWRWTRLLEATRATAGPATTAGREAVLPTRDDDPANRQLYREWFMRTISLLSDRHVPVLVVALPSLDQVAEPGADTRPQQLLEDLTHELNVEYLDLLPTLRSKASAEALYLVHFHPDRPPGQQ